MSDERKNRHRNNHLSRAGHFPFWYNMGKASVAPKLEVGTTEKACVESTPYMKASHMQLLNDWRDEVVREGNRMYVSSTGKKFDMSLQNTCTKCHAKKTEFCDRCHNYVDVGSQVLGLPYRA